MYSPRLLAVTVLALVAAALPASAATTGAATGDGRDRTAAAGSVHVAPDLLQVNGRAEAEDAPLPFRGWDGNLYDVAPFVYEGRNGHLFLGPDLDVACHLGADYLEAMRNYAKIAKIIRTSGREVVFTAAPNKSTVLSRQLDPTSLPHGACDSQGVRDQTTVLRTFDDPSYLPLVDALRDSDHQVYWRTDPHWSSVGGAIFAHETAKRLDRRLGAKQRYTYGSETGLGMLNAELGLETTETLETAFPAVNVRVRTGRGCDEWAGYPTLIYETCWVSSPAQRVHPGRTLLLGDSFMMYALQSMRPLFRKGRFMWVGHSDRDVAMAVKQSDTVVMEVVQLFVPDTILATKSLRRELRKALL